jgi:DNA-binding NtrC family response regulator
MKPFLVLTIDGDPERQEAIAAVLRQAGYEVTVLNEHLSNEALGLSRYDLLLLDLNLSGLDRSALTQSIKGAGIATDTLEAAERRHLASVLRHTGGNKRRAAQLLGISRSTLLNKVRKYGLAG